MGKISTTVTRKETIQTFDHAIVKTIGGNRIKIIGEGVQQRNITYAAGLEKPKEEDGFVKAGVSTMQYSGTPYAIITEKFEN